MRWPVPASRSCWRAIPRCRCCAARCRSTMRWNSDRSGSTGSPPMPRTRSPGDQTGAVLAVTDLLPEKLMNPALIEGVIDARVRRGQRRPDLRRDLGFTIGVGPGFIAGETVDIAVETAPEAAGRIVRGGTTRTPPAESSLLVGDEGQCLVRAPTLGTVVDLPGDRRDAGSGRRCRSLRRTAGAGPGRGMSVRPCAAGHRDARRHALAGGRSAPRRRTLPRHLPPGGHDRRRDRQRRARTLAIAAAGRAA